MSRRIFRQASAVPANERQAMQAITTAKSVSCVMLLPPCWRCYHRAAYPTPEDVLRRVIAGLSAPPRHPRQPLAVQSWGWL